MITKDTKTENLTQEEKEKAEKLGALLSKYKSILFSKHEGRSGNIEPEIAALLQKTKGIRSAYKPKTMMFKPYFWLPIAAGFIIAASLVFHNLPTDKGGNSAGEVPTRNAIMRGGTDNSKPIVNEETTAVAFLTDIKGNVSIERKDRTIKADSSILELFDLDMINCPPDSSASIIFEDAVYKLSPGKYRIMKQEIKKVSEKDEELSPVFTSRGSGLQAKQAPVFIPPAKIMEIAVSSINRAATGKIEVFSPNGKILSLKPVIITTGEADDNYLVSIIPIKEQDKKKFPPITVKGYKVSWEVTGWPMLEPDSTYNLEIRNVKGEILNNPQSSFVTTDSARIKNILESVEKAKSLFSTEPSKIFAEANILYQSGYYSEARILAQKLYKLDEKNKVYLKLFAHCCKKMGFVGIMNDLNEKAKK